MPKIERKIMVLLSNSSIQHGRHSKRNVADSIISANSRQIKENNDKHKKQLKLLDDVKKYASPKKLYPKKCSTPINITPI